MEKAMIDNLFNELTTIRDKSSKIIISKENNTIIIQKKSMPIRIILTILAFICVSCIIWFIKEIDIENDIALKFSAFFMLASFVYLIYKLNRTLLIDFNNKKFMIKFFTIEMNEFDFESLTYFKNELDLSNGIHNMDFKLKIQLNDIKYELGRFKEPKEMEFLNSIFNIIKSNEFKNEKNISNAKDTPNLELIEEELSNGQQINNNQNTTTKDDYCDALSKIWNIIIPINKNNISNKTISWNYTTISDFKKQNCESIELFEESFGQKLKVGNTALEFIKVPFIYNNKEVGSFIVGVYFPVSQMINDLTGLDTEAFLYHSFNHIVSTYNCILEDDLNYGSARKLSMDEYKSESNKGIKSFQISFFDLDTKAEEYRTIWILVDDEFIEYLITIDDKAPQEDNGIFLSNLFDRIYKEFTQQKA